MILHHRMYVCISDFISILNLFHSTGSYEDSYFRDTFVLSMRILQRKEDFPLRYLCMLSQRKFSVRKSVYVHNSQLFRNVL